MNVNLLKAEIVKNGYTLTRLAKELDMAPSTVVRKMKTNSFKMSEAERIVGILRIEKPDEIFFSSKVT